MCGARWTGVDVMDHVRLSIYADKVLGVDDFGLSAPGDQVFEEKGITAAGIVKMAKA